MRTSAPALPARKSSPFWPESDFGRFGTRRSVARLTTHTKEELVGTLVFAVLNFEPKMVGSTKSEVLVLGVQVKKADSGEATFITPSAGNVKLGSKLS